MYLFCCCCVFCSVNWCNKRTNCCHLSLIMVLSFGATLFSKAGSNKLRFNVKTLICAKFDADLINISTVIYKP